MKRRIQPLSARDTMGFEYTGDDDTSRMPGGEIEDNDIIERLSRIFKDMPEYTALDSRDSVVWLALAVGTRVVVVVVVATALVRVVAAAAALVLLVLATNGVVLGVGLVLFVRQDVIMSLRWGWTWGGDDRSLRRCGGGRGHLGRGR
jgi:hypothetical protein